MDILFLVSLTVTAWLAAFLLSISTSSLGCFVLWHRMSYFGETLSHSSMLGFSLALVFDINFYIGLIFTTLLVTLLIFLIQKRSSVLHMDSILGILAHTALSLGLIIIAIMARYVRVDVMDYLFGDILAVTDVDLFILLGVDVFVVITLAFSWKKLLAMLIDQDIARVEGINVDFYKTTLVFMLAIVVAVSISIIGALLITSLLIIPASTARRFSKTPLQMLIYSFIISNIAFIIGVGSSLIYNVPTSPAIVVALGLLFFISLLFRRRDSN